MSVVENFFRHCPSCDRRFEIRLVSKKSVSSESFGGQDDRLQAAPPDGAERSASLQAVLEAGKPFTVDVEEFQYRYKCKHCGHEWAEIRGTDSRANKPKGYTGD
jgi:hypothetical protein